MFKTNTESFSPAIYFTYVDIARAIRPDDIIWQYYEETEDANTYIALHIYSGYSAQVVFLKC
jgi:hypothetical protein